MRRWRKKRDDDDILTFDDLDDDDEYSGGRYVEPGRTRSNPFGDEESDDDSQEYDAGIKIFDDLEPLVRAGQYKPKQSDPYMLHILYQALLDLGEIE